MLNNQDNAKGGPQNDPGVDSLATALGVGSDEGLPGPLGQSPAGDLEEPGLEDFTDLFGEEEPELGPEGQHVEGINVDLSSMTAEERFEFDQEHPGALAAQLMMQSAFTKRSQEIAARETELQRQQGEVTRQQAGLTTLLSQMAGQQQAPASGAPVPSAPPALQTLPQVPDVPSTTPNLDEYMQQARANQDAQYEAQYGQRMGALEKQIADVQMAQFRQQVERSFEELAIAYPQTARPDVRAKIEQAMIANSTAEPELAFLKLIAPSLQKRQKQALEQKALQRKDKPKAKGARAQTRGGQPPKTPGEAKAASAAYLKQHPEALTESE